MNTKVIIILAIVAFACLMVVLLRSSNVKMQTSQTQNIQVTPSLDNSNISAQDPDMKEVEKELNDMESSVDASSFNGI